MSGLTVGGAIGLGLPVLALHMIAVCFTRALRAYSRSRLEELCAARGRPERAVEIAHFDERTERSVEAVAVLSGLILAALLGAVAARTAPELAGGAVVLIALAIGGLGYVVAGIVGRVHAERVLDACWPLAAPFRALTAPLTTTARMLEAIDYRTTRRAFATPRPPSVEVEIHLPMPSDRESEDIEADLPETTREMLERVVELAHRDVVEIMTPRSAIVALPASATARQAVQKFEESGLSRIPLFGAHRDDIVGILYAKDFFPRLVGQADPDRIAPRKLGRPPLFVPETKNAAELLEEFRTRRVQLAIVLDEFGGVSGLITLEDLLEEFVGTIDDEHDEPTPADPVVALGGSRFEVDAAMPLEDLNERLGLHLPTDGDFLTVGGLAFSALGHVPEPGDSFRAEGIEFTILVVVDRSIRRLRLDLQPAAVAGSPAQS